VIELRGVSYRYAGHRRAALRDVNLDLGDGEIVGLVGPNGAGKSTLCLVAAGLAPVAVRGQLEGDVLVDGQRTADLATHELAVRTGIVFADPAAQRSGVGGTVFEEVAFGPVNLGCSPAETLHRVRDAMGRLGVGGLAGRDPSTLSGGQAQLVSIAAMLAMAPRHLVLDEPTAQLDDEGTRHVADALRSLAAAGTALLIADHRADLLAGLGGRVVVLVDGAVAADGPAGTVLAGPVAAAAGVAPPARAHLAGVVARFGRRLPDGIDP
jgi:energy-coupling factor transporter ATP-binding protein EcfA2